MRALHGSDAAVSSPTFIFRQRYDGTPPVEHVDLYRIEDPAELADLALDDAFGPDRITLVEWPEHGGDALPPLTLRVELGGSGESPRHVRVRHAVR